LNSRLDTLQAAILIEKLKLFPGELSMRSLVAQNYNTLLSDVCNVPVLSYGNSSSWAQYTLKLDNRGELQAKLKEVGIPTVVYYPIPLSKQIGYKQYPSVTTGTDSSAVLSEKVLSIPMHPYLSNESQQYISRKIIECLK
jgi:dTDP-4-amino-4,6-dideoxygalactose transaminase